ncbi:hypothetical protein [Streptomyces sp. N50]|uniref:hypothetical protein n=1 Tax=Streptomyces sp. N50 TaxID=3081765 RepID=UPI0029623E15|nr:hypothetical protein [Streptomyces sp. N50]WOX07436.1 hypothetical protein R2B38_00535 [Streptomyces sp. N50]
MTSDNGTSNGPDTGPGLAGVVRAGVVQAAPVPLPAHAVPVQDQEALLTEDLDMALIPRARYDFDPVGHYARPDVFRLHVDTTERRAVRTNDRLSLSTSASLPTTFTSSRATPGPGALGHHP